MPLMFALIAPKVLDWKSPIAMVRWPEFRCPENGNNTLAVWLGLGPNPGKIAEYTSVIWAPFVAAFSEALRPSKGSPEK